jgi:hypothetical protein
MAVAVAQVTQRIVIQGVDQASDAVKKAQGSLKGLEKQAKDTSAATSKVDFKELREQSGDIDTALKGIADFSGAAGQQVSMLGDAFGATEGIMRLIPGPAGLAAVAVAAVGTAAFVAAQEASRAAARIKQEFGGDLLRGVQSLRHEFGLSGETAVELGRALAESGKSAGEVRTELAGVVARAGEVGDDGAAAVRKFAAGLTEGATEAQKLVNRLRAMGAVVEVLNLAEFAPAWMRGDAQKATDEFTKKLGDLETQLKKEKTALADLEAKRTGEVAAYLKRTDVIDGLSSALGFNRRQDQLAREAAQADIIAKDEQRRKIAALTREIETLGERQQDVAEGLRESKAEEAKLVAEDAAREFADAQAAFDQEMAKKRDEAAKKATAAAEKRRAEDAKQAQARVDFAIAQAAKEAALFDAEVDAFAAASGARAKLAESAESAVVDARRKEIGSLAEVLRSRGEFARARAVEAAQDAADRQAEIARIEASIAARRKEAEDRSAELRRTTVAGTDPAAAAREQERLQQDVAALEAERLARTDAVRAEFAAREQRRALDARQDAERQAAELRSQVAQVAAILQSPALAVGGPAGQGLAALASGAEKVAAGFQDFKKNGDSAISASGAIAAAFIEDEKLKAAVLAVTETAASIAAFSVGNIPAGVGHAAAAALYAGVAGGAIGGGGQRGGAAPAGGGFASPSATTATPAPAGGASQNVVINFNQPLVTQADIGKGVHRALRSIGGTGVAKAKGV